MAKPIHEWIERMRAAHARADREEFARVRAMTQEERIAALQAASLTAQRVLEVMTPEALAYRDPLPESSVKGLRRLREKAKHAGL